MLFKKPYGIFLMDALGALASICSLGLVYYFHHKIGMPKNILCSFIGIAITICLYSFSCYTVKPVRWKLYLRILTLLNLAYCGYTAYQVYNHAHSITTIGYAYFIIELMIIISIALYEWHIARQAYHKAMQ